MFLVKTYAIARLIDPWLVCGVHNVTTAILIYVTYRVQPSIPYGVLMASLVSVRSFWVYSEESKNSKLKRIYNICSKGHAVCQQILLRLEWAFGLAQYETQHGLQRRRTRNGVGWAGMVWGHRQWALISLLAYLTHYTIPVCPRIPFSSAIIPSLSADFRLPLHLAQPPRSPAYLQTLPFPHHSVSPLSHVFFCHIPPILSEDLSIIPTLSAQSVSVFVS